ncbi:MAG: hypothetical protein WCJ30_01800 [Deltaproteobacteria bacterium]
MIFKKMMALKDKLTPTEGANVVHVDTFEEPGEELVMIGHFDTVEEAEAVCAARKAAAPGEAYYVYTPETR